MNELKKEKWLNYLALTTVIFAVCATLSTFKGGGFSSRAILAQSQASDQWAFYQSKSIKSYLYELQAEKLQLEMKTNSNTMPKDISSEYRSRIDFYNGKTRKYADEKTKIEQNAKILEWTRDSSQQHAQAFGMAVIFLQIAILLSSIAALLKKKLVWITGILMGIAGMVFFLNGFLLFLSNIMI